MSWRKWRWGHETGLSSGASGYGGRAFDSHLELRDAARRLEASLRNSNLEPASASDQAVSKTRILKFNIRIPRQGPHGVAGATVT